MSGKYNLKWNSHHSEAFQAFDQLRNRELFVDVTLACESQFLKAHKLVLSAGSQYLERILQRDSSSSPSIHFFGIEMHILRLLVEFMYKGEVEVPSADLERFIQMADNLEVKGLKGDGRPKGSGSKSMPINDLEPPLALKRRMCSLSAPNSPYPLKQQRLNAMNASSVAATSTEVGRAFFYHLAVFLYSWQYRIILFSVFREYFIITSSNVCLQGTWPNHLPW